MRIVAWVMGEYGQFCTGKPVDIEEEDDDDDEEEIVALSPMEIIRTLWQVIEKQGENLSTRQWTMSATCKLCRHLDEIPVEIESIVAKYRNSTHSDLVQLSHELIELCKERDCMTYVFEESSVVDDIKVDTDLKFLNHIVDQQIKDGKRRYSPPDEYDADSDDEDNKHRGSSILIEHRTARQDMESMLQVQATQDPIQNDPYGGGAGLGGNPYGGNDIAQVQQESEPEEEFGGGGLKKIGGGGAKRRGPWGDHVGRDSESEEDATEIVSAAKAAYDEPVISVATYESRPARPTSDISAPVKPRRKEREMTAKEREAASLFGGLGGGGGSTKKRRTRKKIIKRAGSGAVKPKSKPKAKGRKKQVQQEPEPEVELEPEPEPEQKQQAASQEDLLNFAMGGAPAQEPKTAPIKQQAPADDLLGDIFGSGAPSQTQAAKPVAHTQQSGSDDLLGDLFGGPPSSTGTIPTMGGDIFGSLASSPQQNTNQQQPMMGGGQMRGFAALKSQLGAKVMGFPRSHDTDQILFENSQLQMSYFKIFKQQKSTLCIFISNLSSSALSNIQVGVKKSNMQCQLQFGFDVSNSIPNPKLRNATTAIIPLLNGGSTACQMITFGLTNPTQISMPCNIIVSINNEILTIALKMSDLLRASIITTKDFGTNWGKLSQGSFALNVNTGNSSIPNYVNKITKLLHIHHIETIKNEIIAAGNLSSIVNAQMLLPILIHCKCIQTQSYSVIIRTPNVNISKAIGIELQQLLSS